MRTTYPRTPTERRAVADLCAEAFVPNHRSLHVMATRDLEEDPRFKPQYWRTVVRKGRPVSNVGIYERTVRVGAATLKMGGIGFVCTHPDWQRHGFASVAMRDAIRTMEEEGFHITTLFGRDRYYLRFGYIGCFPSLQMRIRVTDLDALKNRFRVVPYDRKFLPEMQEIYEAQCLDTPCAALRDAKTWAYGFKRHRLLEGEPPPGRIFLDGRRVAAHVFLRDNNTSCLGFRKPEGADAILAYLRDAARGRIEQQVVLGGIPANHPMAAHARRFNHESSVTMRLTGSGMGRIVDLPRFLDAMTPEFERRMSAAGLVGEGHLHIHVKGEKSQGKSLILSRARPVLGSSTVYTATLRTTMQGLFQLAIGTFDLEDVPETAWQGDEPFLRSLFRERHPWVYDIDRF